MTKPPPPRPPRLLPRPLLRRLALGAAFAALGLAGAAGPAGAAAPEGPLRTPEPLPPDQPLRPLVTSRPAKPRVIRGTPLPVWRPSAQEPTARPGALRALVPGGYRPMRPIGVDLESRWRVLSPAEAPGPGMFQLPRFAPRAWARTFFPYYQEQHGLGGLTLRPETIERLEAGLGLFAPDGWQSEVQLAYLNLTIADRQLPDSRHQRDDFMASWMTGRAFSLGPIASQLEAGYWGRYVSISNNMPPPATGRFLTSPFQLYHGPAVRTAFGGDLGGAWRWSTRLEGRPYLLAHGDDAVVATGPLFGTVAEPSLSWEPLFGTVLEAGYRFELLTSYRADYTQSLQGPYLECRRKF
ncbi:MAG: hypothetical protein VKS61_14075 [Candidatus Sericytochromatia bacterium]|nr:hypothetical protein [Candidatus Sericytochromatia bacterium]